MPKLVILNGGPDTAGVGIGLKQAFDKYTNWQTRAVCRGTNYLYYPTDFVWPLRGEIGKRRLVTQMVAGADVIHVMDSERVLGHFQQVLKHQKIVVHHLGSHYRRDPVGVSLRCKSYGAIQVTDSIDLISEDVAFLPVPYDVDVMQRVPNTSDRIRIAHAPTQRPVKSTARIIEVIEELSKRYPIDFDLIEGVSNRECLERKAKADIFVDQLLYGFGLNNIECWSMGIPVVSGLVDRDARQRALAMWGDWFPWADATEATLPSVIEHLILNPDWRSLLADKGRRHAIEWHSQESVVKRTLAVYQMDGMKTTPVPTWQDNFG